LYVEITLLVCDGILMMAPSVQLPVFGGGWKPPPPVAGFGALVVAAGFVAQRPSYDEPE